MSISEGIMYRSDGDQRGLSASQTDKDKERTQTLSGCHNAPTSEPLSITQTLRSLSFSLHSCTVRDVGTVVLLAVHSKRKCLSASTKPIGPSHGWCPMPPKSEPTCLILMAAHKPLGPAPTIKTSYRRISRSGRRTKDASPRFQNRPVKVLPPVERNPGTIAMEDQPVVPFFRSTVHTDCNSISIEIQKLYSTPDHQRF